MTNLQPKDQTGLRQLFILLGLTGLVTVVGCLGLLWMRQQIEAAARETSELEVRMKKEERRLRYLDAKIAEIHQPGYLAAQVERLGLDLAPPRADRVVYLTEPSGADPERQWARAEKRKSAEPFRRAVDLAVMESFLPRD